MSAIRRKLPELLLEAVSVVFAVLVALAVDEWREDRNNAELADRALDAITAEIGDNLSELDNARGKNRDMLEMLNGALEGSGEQGFGVEFEYTQLSSAAWRTAQVTQAVHYLEYGLVQRLARLHDLQELFVESQRSLVDFMGSGGGGGTPDEILTLLRARLTLVMDLEAGLVEAIQEVLEDLQKG